MKTGSLEHVRDSYLNLLTASLTHTLYSGVDRMPLPVAVRDAWTRANEEAGEGPLLFDDAQVRVEGRDVPLYGQTMIGLERMRNLRQCVEAVLAEDVPGDLIEAGAWRGGAAILMRGILMAYGVDTRKVWVADSFRGFPPSDADWHPVDHAYPPPELEYLAVPVEEVRDNFRRYGLLDDQVRFVEGWFRDTLPGLRDSQWSVIRIDGDMYGSTMDALVNLYGNLSPGGFLIIDDFAIPACHQAVEDFRRDHDILEPVEEIDWTGVFWRKGG